MKQLLRILSFAVALLPAVASAQYANLVRMSNAGTILSTTCDATLTTTAVYVEGYNALTLSWVTTDANSSITAVTATCVGTGYGDSDAATTYKLPVLTSTTAGGVASYVPFTYSYATTAATGSQFTLGVNGNRYAKCTFVCGGAAADSIVVKATVTAQ